MHNLIDPTDLGRGVINRESKNGDNRRPPLGVNSS